MLWGGETSLDSECWIMYKCCIFHVPSDLIQIQPIRHIRLTHTGNTRGNATCSKSTACLGRPFNRGRKTWGCSPLN
ncbi:hypothetical protein XELAEV_18038059mg [Xenopus laevis]|uniref:Uncharacterized protein n=1 Tax=Xenopus laevis TaxID=8355 RepID=A0A974CEF9_XENLA|nr:hypothetical protein XELAEV_18038059mg [Xenopus laevis]